MLERGFERALQVGENKNAVRQFAIIQARRILQEARVVDPKLEGDSSQAVKVEAASKIDLRQQTYDLLSQVRQPSADEKEALKEKGIKFFHVASISYAQVIAKDPAYFWEQELKYANSRPQLRDYTLPVAVEVGLRHPSELALPGSFGKSRETQLEMIDEYSQELQAQFPGSRAIMLPSTGYAQVDKAYKAETGEVLFRNYFARALDNLSRVSAAGAGRGGPSSRFRVDEWDHDDGHDHVGAVPAVVFIGNK